MKISNIEGGVTYLIHLNEISNITVNLFFSCHENHHHLNSVQNNLHVGGLKNYLGI